MLLHNEIRYAQNTFFIVVRKRVKYVDAKRRISLLLLFFWSLFAFSALASFQEAMTEQEAETYIQGFIQDLTKSNKSNKTENEFISRLDIIHQGITLLDEYKVSLLKAAADEAYNQDKFRLFFSIKGILNDYDLSANNPRAVLSRLDRLKKLDAYSLLDDSVRVELEIDRLLSWNNLFESNKSINYLATVEALQATAEQKIRLILTTAEAKANSGNLSGAVEEYSLALDLIASNEADLNISQKALIFNDLGVIYQELNDYDKALAYYEQGLAISNEHTLLEVEKRILSNKGILFKNIGQYELALENYNKAIELALNLNDEYTVAQNLYNMGNLYLEQKKFDLASNYFKQVEEIVVQWGQDREYSLVLAMRGAVEMESKNYEKALEFMLQALEIQRQLDDPMVMIQVYEKLQDLKERQKDFENALMYHELAETLKDSIDAQNQRIELQKREREFDTQRAELERRLLEKMVLTQQIRNRGLTIILVTVIVFLIIIRFYQRRQFGAEKKLLEYSIRLTRLTEPNLQSDLYSVYFERPNRNLIEQNKPLWDLFNNMLNSIVNGKLYADPDFNVTELAKIMKSNTRYVSSAINTFSGLSFNHFVNRFRINESKKLMAQYDLNKSLEQIMEESGFQNRATFYRAFKNEVGVTPNEFRQKIKMGVG